MHLHFERNSNARCDCPILSLTWMGKVPDELPEEEGWKLNRTNYYQEGWLATGNVRGIVGVTFTTSHCRKNPDFPLRTNYNLRGHRSEVILVKWNEPYQKLASCDSSGIIFVWIKYEGRWSIELINDRNTPVTHFAWSHDGRMAVICYQDGFVLVGSVAGQRYWSSMLSLESTITCGIWTPDDQQVYFGTTSGRLIVMDVHGAMVSQVQLAIDHASITTMAWSCEKFKMEENEEPNHSPNSVDDRGFVLAVCLKSGLILLMKHYDDVSPVILTTGLIAISMEWSNSREILAVAGTRPQGSNDSTNECINTLLFYSDTGVLIYSVSIPHTQSPVTALTWGHNDKRLFIATGYNVHIAWVSRRIASLQLLSGLRTHEQLKGESQVAALPLPPRIRALITNLFAQTIRVSECFVPEVQHIREFVSRPPKGSIRLHCTMIRHDEETNISAGTCYTLYLEYLGGLVPLLKGKRTSKIRPEFVIFDPQHDEFREIHPATSSQSSSSTTSHLTVDPTDSSDTEHDEGCASPRVQRRRRKRRKSQGPVQAQAGERAEAAETEDLTYVDTLPEHVRLVQVTSNIWGTKFKIHGLAASLPANLGQVTYKTSLLHLQPRQMTLVITELRDDLPPGPDPTFNPNLFSEDEEEAPVEQARKHQSHNDIAPIAPMTPRPQSARSRFQVTRAPARATIDSATGGNEAASGYSNRNTSTTSTSASAAASSQRHLPPLCGGGGETQSSKNSVAPRDSMDVLTELPSQTSDFASNIHRLKNAIIRSTATVNEHHEATASTSNCSASGNNATSNANNSTSNNGVKSKRREKLTSSLGLTSRRRTDESEASSSVSSRRNDTTRRGLQSPYYLSDPMVRSCSVGYLDLVDLALNSHGPLGDINPNDAAPPKRLVLVHKKKEIAKPKLKHSGKSKSLDSSDIFPQDISRTTLYVPPPQTPQNAAKTSVTARLDAETSAKFNLINAMENLNVTPSTSTATSTSTAVARLPHSTPASPAVIKKSRNRNNSPIRQLLNSPLLSRRARKARAHIESSDDENVCAGDEAKNYRDLESFQKAQLKQKKLFKLRRGKGDLPPKGPRRREFVMHNKAPMWNENSQVYQLDFGGRVTQESAKNFQIEFRGKQVMQFGRIDGNAYTLDFQYPFSALQAFAVALANVTQRLK